MNLKEVSPASIQFVLIFNDQKDLPSHYLARGLVPYELTTQLPISKYRTVSRTRHQATVGVNPPLVGVLC